MKIFGVSGVLCTHWTPLKMRLNEFLGYRLSLACSMARGDRTLKHLQFFYYNNNRSFVLSFKSLFISQSLYSRSNARTRRIFHQYAKPRHRKRCLGYLSSCRAERERKKPTPWLFLIHSIPTQEYNEVVEAKFLQTHGTIFHYKPQKKSQERVRHFACFVLRRYFFSSLFFFVRMSSFELSTSIEA